MKQPTLSTGTGSEFQQRVFAAVGLIPPGRVATYGQLAIMAGRPGGARHAGRALAQAPAGLPCHRVVNSSGRTAPGWPQQAQLLRQEGVGFRPNGCVNLKNHRWQPF